jgi:hypothetical protein
MYANAVERQGGVDPIVDQDLAAAGCCETADLRCKGNQLSCAEVSFTDLYARAPRFQRLCQDASQRPPLCLLTIGNEK